VTRTNARPAMRFSERKRRQPPAIIIVSLIDILIVLLIFLMVTTTFKQFPAIKLTLPESRQPREGVSDTEPVVVSIARQPPHFYLGDQPVTLEQLQANLHGHLARNPQLEVAVRPDTDAPVGQFVGVMDAVKAAGVRKPVSIFTKKPSTP